MKFPALKDIGFNEERIRKKEMKMKQKMKVQSLNLTESREFENFNIAESCNIRFNLAEKGEIKLHNFNSAENSRIRN